MYTDEYTGQQQQQLMQPRPAHPMAMSRAQVSQSSSGLHSGMGGMNQIYGGPQYGQLGPGPIGMPSENNAWSQRESSRSGQSSQLGGSLSAYYDVMGYPPDTTAIPRQVNNMGTTSGGTMNKSTSGYGVNSRMLPDYYASPSAWEQPVTDPLAHRLNRLPPAPERKEPIGGGYPGYLQSEASRPSLSGPANGIIAPSANSAPVDPFRPLPQSRPMPVTSAPLFASPSKPAPVKTATSRVDEPPSSVPVQRSSLLEEFRNNKNRKFTLQVSIHS